MLGKLESKVNQWVGAARKKERARWENRIRPSIPKQSPTPQQNIPLQPRKPSLPGAYFSTHGKLIMSIRCVSLCRYVHEAF
jgi:hypothetical protein